MDARSVRRFAAAMAAAVAVSYYLVGLEVLDVGGSTSGTTDILGFGLIVGSVFLLASALLLLVERRWAWIIVSLIDILAIVGYVAMAGVRAEPFAVWGLLIKAFQVALLAALGYLLLRGSERGQASDGRPAPR